MSIVESISTECTKLVEDINKGKYTLEELTKINGILRRVNYSPDPFNEDIDPQTALYLVRGMILSMAMEEKN